MGDAVEFSAVAVLEGVFSAVEADLVFGGVGADECVLCVCVCVCQVLVGITAQKGE